MAKPLGSLGGSQRKIAAPPAVKLGKPAVSPGKISGFGAASKAAPKLPKMPPISRTGPKL